MGFVNERMRLYVHLRFHINVILAHVRVSFSTSSFLVQQGLDGAYRSVPKADFL